MTESQDSHQACADEIASSYLMAFEDLPFLKRDELRPIRLGLELLKPQILQNEHGVTSTVVVFGGARILEKEKAEAEEEAR